MKQWIPRVGLAIGGVLLLVGCASLQGAREAHAMSDARQIAWARITMMHEHPDNAIPTLNDIVDSHPVLDAERVAPFEVTEEWADPNAAGDAVILRQKKAAGGRRVVALADGTAMVAKDGGR